MSEFLSIPGVNVEVHSESLFDFLLLARGTCEAFDNTHACTLTHLHTHIRGIVSDAFRGRLFHFYRNVLAYLPLSPESEYLVLLRDVRGGCQTCMGNYFVSISIKYLRN